MVQITIDIEKLKKKVSNQNDFDIVEGKIYHKDKLVAEYKNNNVITKDSNFILIIFSIIVNPF